MSWGWWSLTATPNLIQGLTMAAGALAERGGQRVAGRRVVSLGLLAQATVICGAARWSVASGVLTVATLVLLVREVRASDRTITAQHMVVAATVLLVVNGSAGIVGMKHLERGTGAPLALFQARQSFNMFAPPPTESWRIDAAYRRSDGREGVWMPADDLEASRLGISRWAEWQQDVSRRPETWPATACILLRQVEDGVEELELRAWVVDLTDDAADAVVRSLAVITPASCEEMAS